MRRLSLPKLTVLMALLLVASSLFVAPSASAQGAVRDFGAESGFLVSLNQQRAAGGLAPLTLNGSMTAAADGWALTMTNGSFLAHAGDIVSGTPGSWTKVGENVGRGQSVSSLTSAFMNSPGHRANIMDVTYTHIGIAVYVHPSDGRIYTTHRFAALTAAAPAAPVPVAPVAEPTQIPPTPVPPTPVPPTPVPPTPVPPTPVPPTPVPPTPVPPTPVPPTPVPPTPVPPTPVPPTPVPPTPVPPTPVPPTPVPAIPEPELPETPAPDGGFGEAPEQLAFVDTDTDTLVEAAQAKLASKTAKFGG